MDGGWVSDKVAEDSDKTFEASISCEDFSDFGRSGGEVHEVGERVEKREWRGTVEACEFSSGIIDDEFDLKPKSEMKI